MESNLEEAVRLYRLAAEKGNATAQFNLGCFHDEGRSVAQNATDAGKWFGRAAEEAHLDSIYQLSVLGTQGKGAKKNLAAAYQWFNLAAALGHKQALADRDGIRGQLTAEQLAQGQRLATEYYRKLMPKLAAAQSAIQKLKAAGQGK